MFLQLIESIEFESTFEALFRMLLDVNIEHRQAFQSQIADRAFVHLDCSWRLFGGVFAACFIKAWRVSVGQHDGHGRAGEDNIGALAGQGMTVFGSCIRGSGSRFCKILFVFVNRLRFDRTGESAFSRAPESGDFGTRRRSHFVVGVICETQVRNRSTGRFFFFVNLKRNIISGQIIKKNAIFSEINRTTESVELIG